MVCWFAVFLFILDFFRKFGGRVFFWKLVFAFWDGVLAWGLEGRVFLNFFFERSCFVLRGFVVAGGFSLGFW